ncbi:hypothetical protein [Actinosynnema sp. NPDC023587]|uniref:hypothetical protein n=1 Tax=Actinosynnema sp. NPDC023587 TaxID=3154695 RepID=UPI0033FFD628
MAFLDEPMRECGRVSIMRGRLVAKSRVSVADRVEAFRARAAEVRACSLFQQEVREFSFGFTMENDAVRYCFPKVDRARQHYCASLLRPFLSESDTVSLNRCFGVFGAALDDPGLRRDLGAIRADYRTARQSSMFSAAVWRVDERPPEKWYTDWEIAHALLYGDLLHLDAGLRRLLRSLVPPGGDPWDHQAVMMMFHVTARTALRVDDLLHVAQDRGALPR